VDITKIVFEHRGTLDKCTVTGDGFWGRSFEEPDHALNACNASLAMMNTVARDATMEAGGKPNAGLLHRPEFFPSSVATLSREIGGKLGGCVMNTALGYTVNLCLPLEGLKQE